MIDVDLLVQVLRKRGHTVESVFGTGENAGTCNLIVDGDLMAVSEARYLLEQDTGPHPGFSESAAAHR